MPALGLEPLASILDLRLDAGEVRTAQGHQDFMAVEGGLQRDRDWRLGQWRGLQGLRAGRRLPRGSLGQDLHHPFLDARGNSVTVDARVAPHTSASKPCMRVSPHTAPQLLSPCHGCMQDVPCLVNPLLQQKKELFFSSLPSFDVALSLRLWSHLLLAALPSQ
jgi:hypothetical protein